MIPTMSWLPSRPPDATRAIHPDTLTQPVIQERSGRHFGQAITLNKFNISTGMKISSFVTVTRSKCPTDISQVKDFDLDEEV